VWVSQVLDVDLEWRMHKVSDGQRRRVQICMGLLRPFKVLLLDEITVDLDVVGRGGFDELLKGGMRRSGARVLCTPPISSTGSRAGPRIWPTSQEGASSSSNPLLKSRSCNP